MATNSSEHLGLHLWEPTDQVLRTEFNQNWQKIDTAVNTAQETAEEAQDAAGAAYCPSYKPYATGNYIGTGANLTVTLGFKPSFLIIYGGQLTYSTGVDDLPGYLLISNGSSLTEFVAFTDVGFTLIKRENTDYPQLLLYGRTYSYIAFR